MHWEKKSINLNFLFYFRASIQDKDLKKIVIRPLIQSNKTMLMYCTPTHPPIFGEFCHAGQF